MKNETGNEPTKILKCNQPDCMGKCMPNETKHTPGPWKVTAGNIIRTCEGTEWIDLASVKDSADARLIAAAPELLEALHNIIANLSGQDYLQSRIEDSIRRAEEAIKKTEG